MQLDYVENINEFGENVVRLFDFDMEQARYFRDLIQEIIINRNLKLDLSRADFIEPQNCNMIMGIYKEDEGIVTEDHKTFFCLLTLSSYERMIELLAPFCKKESQGFEYLYDVDNPTDLLFAPTATSLAEVD